MEDNLAFDKTKRIRLRRILPFSFWVVAPFTVWYVVVLVAAIWLILVDHLSMIYIPVVLIPFIAWYILVLDNAILFRKTRRVATGRIVDRNEITKVDRDGDKYYQCYVTVEFKPENGNDDLILEARVPHEAFPSSRQEEILIAYASAKPQLAVLEGESLTLREMKKRTKTKTNIGEYFWKKRIKPLMVPILVFSLFELGGGFFYVIGLELHIGAFLIGLAFLSLPFYYSTEKLLRHE